MYFQFLLEDKSTEILINHIMEKVKETYPDKLIDFNVKSFKGIGHLSTRGSLQERKGSGLLNNLNLLRLDLRSDYEQEDNIFEILSLIIPSVFELFKCQIVATKIPSFASERKLAISRLGFAASEEKLIGHDKTVYTDYYVLKE